MEQSDQGLHCLPFGHLPFYFQQIITSIIIFLIWKYANIDVIW